MTDPAHRDAPGVIAIPPLIYVGFLALGFAVDWLVPAAFLPDGVQYAAGLALIAAGAAIVVPVVRGFRGAGTNLDVRKPATALVTAGPFRFSRNPAYVALSLLHAGIAVMADNPWALGLLAPALLVMHFGVILREERYLERKFGAEYLRYKASVRRWL
jgi:protein-S-isoprenylcysteine O-methyltransferase Ste14